MKSNVYSYMYIYIQSGTPIIPKRKRRKN